jgi:hypothetical protein
MLRFASSSDFSGEAVGLDLRRRVVVVVVAEVVVEEEEAGSDVAVVVRCVSISTCADCTTATFRPARLGRARCSGVRITASLPRSVVAVSCEDPAGVAALRRVVTMMSAARESVQSMRSGLR